MDIQTALPMLIYSLSGTESSFPLPFSVYMPTDEECNTHLYLFAFWLTTSTYIVVWYVDTMRPLIKNSDEPQALLLR